MPYYTYVCDNDNCEHSEEIYLSISNRDTRVGDKCPDCSDGKLRRSVEFPGFTTSESLGRKKAPAEFRDFMKILHKNTRGSQMKI